MLFVKPLYLISKLEGDHKPKKKADGNKYFEFENEEEEKGNLSHQDPDHEVSKDDTIRLEFDEVLQQEAGIKDDHNVSEIFIHQLIETIEFVLGTISNTASYLRLWALSLAHSQLSAVFFDKLIGEMALHGKGNPYVLFLLFPVWASFTFFVLMCMDSMECFLHTLRLHWVEFQNKFYHGNGYRFSPYSFHASLTLQNKI